MRRLAQAVRARQLFPCFFGSALKLEGVDGLLSALDRLTLPLSPRKEFGARVFKVTKDSSGARLAWLKVTGGELRVKAELSSRPDARRAWTGKADQLRLYSGEKFRLVESAPAGAVVAAAGLGEAYPGEGLGFEEDAAAPALEPVLRYRVLLPEGCDVHKALGQLRELEQEDPLLHVVWNGRLGQIHLQLMGEVQLEVLQSLLERRFGLRVSFDEGGILYKETISARVEGVGHYEPLRHYAEVHLLLEPGPRGSGLEIATACREDELAGNWQRLVLTHLAEKTHLGPLTGAPLTDVKITLAAGRAHIKHTEGGDFRQATYRAVRQGLRTAQAQGACVLLEPWYDFTLRLPQECVGRALADMPRLWAQFEPPVSQGGEAVIQGRAPVALVCGATPGRWLPTPGAGGQLSCLPGGYAPCHNPEEVVAAVGYDADGDLENTADSVFCSHGAGVLVPWDKVPVRMHLEKRPLPGGAPCPGGPGGTGSPRRPLGRPVPAPTSRPWPRTRNCLPSSSAPTALSSGIPARPWPPSPAAPRGSGPRRSGGKAASQQEGPEHLLVDGYNVIFSWEELKALAQENLEAARGRLMDNPVQLRRLPALRAHPGFRRLQGQGGRGLGGALPQPARGLHQGRRRPRTCTSKRPPTASPNTTAPGWSPPTLRSS